MDEEFERAWAPLAALGEAHEIVRLEAMLIASPDGGGHVPMPGEVHPAYADRAWLIEWVNRRGPYADRCDVLIPTPRRLSALWLSPNADPDPADLLGPPPTRLTRQRCWGLAPYVGEPFVYTWDAAADSYGRVVAGDARREYIPAS